MANKVDVFTEELSKVFTILQQQYVMIKYMKALITSGELDETEINKLKEQITAINNNIDTIIDDQIVPIKQDILRIEEGMSEFEKVMPTDINADINGNLILEHDGIEITGQKKQVAVYTKAQVNALISDTGLKTFKLEYPYTGTFPTANHKQTSITYSDDINTVYKCINYVKENGVCLLKMRNVTSTSTGITELNPVFILCLLVPNSDTSTIKCYGTTGEYMVTLVSNGDTTSQNNTFIIYDKIAKASDSGGSQLFRHNISIYNDDSSIGFVFEYITDTNLKVDSIQDLNTITHASAGTNILCSVLNAGQNFSLNTDCNGIHFDGSNWQYGFVINDTIFSERLLTIGTIDDVVTTI